MHSINKRDRRFFLKNLVSLFLISSCSGKSEPEKTYIPKSCDDYSGLEESDLQLRKGFGYVASSPVAESQCKNCNLYKVALPGENCGGCTLFKGPVVAEGYCTYWAPVV